MVWGKKVLGRRHFPTENMTLFLVLVALLALGCVWGFVPFMGQRRRTAICMSDACGPCPMAPKCKGADRNNGCDGTGKIQGGIATIPLFSWWPIKVFRPCPSYLTAGYQYRREGQTMDQVLFSEPSTKQAETWSKIQAEKAAIDKDSNADKEKIDEERKKNLSEADKFLEDTFGN